MQDLISSLTVEAFNLLNIQCFWKEKVCVYYNVQKTSWTEPLLSLTSLSIMCQSFVTVVGVVMDADPVFDGGGQVMARRDPLSQG